MLTIGASFSAFKHFWVLQTQTIHSLRTLQSTGSQTRLKLLKPVICLYDLSIMYQYKVEHWRHAVPDYAFAICPWFSFLSSTLQLKNGHVFMQVVPEDHKLVKKKNPWNVIDPLLNPNGTWEDWSWTLWITHLKLFPCPWNCTIERCTFFSSWIGLYF